MKYLFILFVLYGCQSASTQAVSDENMKELEFQKLMQGVQKTNELSAITQQKAAEKEVQIVGKAVSTIVSLKSEVNQLKSELNEIKSKLDSANTVDTSSEKFQLRPIR
jgi:RNA processing factor Prp31|tara:strand:+ start:109 stop:432 length:324 start_codon:yes stop_codon:yes gene_type:complete